MKLIRAVPLVLVAVIMTGCSPTGSSDGALPSTNSANEVIESTAASDCTDLVAAYDTWMWMPTTSMEYSQATMEALLDEGEAFLGEVSGFDGAPIGELAGAVTTYNEAIELLLSKYEAGGSGDLYEVEMALYNVTSEYEALIAEVC